MVYANLAISLWIKSPDDPRIFNQIEFIICDRCEPSTAPLLSDEIKHLADKNGIMLSDDHDPLIDKVNMVLGQNALNSTVLLDEQRNIFPLSNLAFVSTKLGWTAIGVVQNFGLNGEAVQNGQESRYSKDVAVNLGRNIDSESKVGKSNGEECKKLLGVNESKRNFWFNIFKVLGKIVWTVFSK